MFPLPVISIDPGDSWMRSYTVWPKPECELTLIGKGKFNGSFISAFEFSQEITNVQSGVESRRRAVGGDQSFIEASWKQEPFATESGLHGVHISYTRQYPAPFRGWMVLMTQTSHEYLVTNAQSRCVAIVHTTDSRKSIVSARASDEVQEIIRRTMRTE